MNDTQVPKIVNESQSQALLAPRLHAHPSRWQSFVGETRTRILLLYVLFILLFMGVSIPVYRALLFVKVEARVKKEMLNEANTFRAQYEAWERSPNPSRDSLMELLDRFFSEERPADDNYLIAIVDQELYRINPTVLIEPISPSSELVKSWKQVTTPIEGEKQTGDPTAGNVLYIAQPLIFNDEVVGVFVVAHATEGERKEALEAVTTFIWLGGGSVLVSFVLAWLATGRLLAPVKQLAATAQQVSESDLHQRLPVQGQGEMADLANTFNNMMERLQTAFENQRNFINDAGHELRTPITIIRGHLELMGDDPQEKEETMETVLDELDRMSRLVNDMILLAKSEQPHFLQLETIDIETFTDDLFSKATALANRDWRLVAKGRGRVVVDRQRLTGAMINLAQNAAQHTLERDLIEIGTSLKPGELRLWVRDAGEGISPTDQQRIFERFARATNSYRRSDGSGLGLAIVRAIVEAHGGRVELSSQLGIGSTFILVLPLEVRAYKLSQEVITL